MSSGPPPCPYCSHALRLGDGLLAGFWYCEWCRTGVSQQQVAAVSSPPAKVAKPAGKVLKGPWPAT